MLIGKYFTRRAKAFSRLALAAGFCSFFVAVPSQAGEIHLASAPVGNPEAGSSFSLRWDAAGRFGVFVSLAANLFPGQGINSSEQVFLYDRHDGSVRLVSHVPGDRATGANGGLRFTDSPHISDDGNWVVYNSTATDLVPGQQDDNEDFDVFLWSREQDVTFLVSHRAGSVTTTGNALSSVSPLFSAISGDGRFVVYSSGSTDLVAGQQANTFSQVYQYDRTSGRNVLVSHAANNLLRSGNGNSRYVLEGRGGRVISSDGRWVVFSSAAEDLAAGVSDRNGEPDVFLWDRDAGLAFSLRLLSRRAGAPLSTCGLPAGAAAIAADGSAVVFTSLCSDLEGVTSDTNGVLDVFRYDRLADRVELVSHGALSSTRTADGRAFLPSISSDGKRIAFQSGATNHVLLQTDYNGEPDVFLWLNGPIRLMSHIPSSLRETGNGPSMEPLIAADGSGVAFTSMTTNLVAGIDFFNGGKNVYWRSQSGPGVVLVSHVPSGSATGDRPSFLTDVALDGALISFNSPATNLVDTPVNRKGNVFFHLDP